MTIRSFHAVGKVLVRVRMPIRIGYEEVEDDLEGLDRAWKVVRQSNQGTQVEVG